MDTARAQRLRNQDSAASTAGERPRSSREAARLQDIRLEEEHYAEFDYQPAKCCGSCRMVVVRKTLIIERGDQLLFPDIR